MNKKVSDQLVETLVEAGIQRIYAITGDSLHHINAAERVQKLLGHSSINETLIYAHLIPDDMHEDVSVLINLE